MRVLAAGATVALLAALTFANPAEAARPAPPEDPYISRMTATATWVQDSFTLDWHYVLNVSVWASGLGFRPSYMPCTKVAYSPSGELVTGEQLLFARSPRPHVTVASRVDIQFGAIVAGSTSLTLTSQLMRIANHGCCTDVGPLRTLTADLPSPRPSHDQAVVILDRTFPAP